MTSLNLSLGPLLHDAARLIRRRFEQHTADLGLSSAQWRLLIHVLKEERVTQARLAERLEIEPISVSRLIDRMVQAGWVMRETDPNSKPQRLPQPALDVHSASRRRRAAETAAACRQSINRPGSANYCRPHS